MTIPKGPLPPLIADPVFEILIAGTQGAGGSSVTRASNAFYYRQTGGPAAVLAALTTIFRTTVIVPLIAAANVRYAVNALGTRPLRTPTTPMLLTPDAGVGAIATDPSPSGDCAVVNLYTTGRGKSGRGFRHFAGVNESDTTQDILTGAGLARWQAVRDATKLGLTDANGSTYVPFLLSKSWSQIITTPVSIYGYDVVNAKLNTVVAVMRRRKAKSVLS